MSADVRWVTAMLDSPPGSSAASEAFWLGVTGARLSPSRGRRHELASLVPSDGDGTLKVQRVVQSSPGAMHLDLACDDREAETSRHLALGAEPVDVPAGWTVLRDPAGRSYCITEWRPGDV